MQASYPSKLTVQFGHRKIDSVITYTVSGCMYPGSSQGLYTFNYSATSRFPPSQLQPAAEKSKRNGDAVLFADMDSNGDALLSAEEFSLAGLLLRSPVSVSVSVSV